MAGYIKLHRQLLESLQFSDPNYLKVWVWILLKANHKSRRMFLKINKGTTDVNVERGQFIFGRNKAAEELNMSESLIYRIVKRFEQDLSIVLKSNNHYTILTVCNYDSYNGNDDLFEQPTNNQRTTNEQPTDTNKNDKKEKNVKNDKKIFMPPSVEEVELYFSNNGYEPSVGAEAVKWYTKSDWIDRGGKKIINWKLKMQQVWFKDENKIKPDIDIEYTPVERPNNRKPVLGR